MTQLYDTVFDLEKTLKLNQFVYESNKSNNLGIDLRIKTNEALNYLPVHLVHQLQNQNTKLLNNSLILKCINKNLTNAHANNETTKQSNSNKFKTELCRQFNENGECKYGDKCQFAHGYCDLNNVNRHPKYKTDYCKTFYSKGFCPYGPRCHFIHEVNEKLELSNESTKKNFKNHQNENISNINNNINSCINDNLVKQLDILQLHMKKNVFPPIIEDSNELKHSRSNESIKKSDNEDDENLFSNANNFIPSRSSSLSSPIPRTRSGASSTSSFSSVSSASSSSCVSSSSTALDFSNQFDESVENNFINQTILKQRLLQQQLYQLHQLQLRQQQNKFSLKNDLNVVSLNHQDEEIFFPTKDEINSDQIQSNSNSLFGGINLLNKTNQSPIDWLITTDMLKRELLKSQLFNESVSCNQAMKNIDKQSINNSFANDSKIITNKDSFNNSVFRQLNW